MNRWSASQPRRIAINFGLDGQRWNEELVLQRYETLWEAGLVAEAGTGRGVMAPGEAMRHDHRRILARGSRGCWRRSNTGRWCSH